MDPSPLCFLAKRRPVRVLRTILLSYDTQFIQHIFRVAACLMHHLHTWIGRTVLGITSRPAHVQKFLEQTILHMCWVYWKGELTGVEIRCEWTYIRRGGRRVLDQFLPIFVSVLSSWFLVRRGGDKTNVLGTRMVHTGPKPVFKVLSWPMKSLPWVACQASYLELVAT